MAVQIYIDFVLNTNMEHYIWEISVLFKDFFNLNHSRIYSDVCLISKLLPLLLQSTKGNIKQNIIYYPILKWVHLCIFPGQSLQQMPLANMSSIGCQSDLKLTTNKIKQNKNIKIKMTMKTHLHFYTFLWLIVIGIIF